MRVFLDANILISYLLQPATESSITIIMEAAVAGGFTLLVSEVLLTEFTQRIPSKPYLARRITADQIDRLVGLLLVIAETVPAFSEPIPRVTRDPKDDYFLAYALVGQADYLVTGNRDLLTLKQVVELKIITAREFAALL